MRIIQCHISLLEDHAFNGLVQLKVLQIAECGRTSMAPVSDVKGTLTELSLNSDHVSCVPHGYFQGFKKLCSLSLVGNLLIEIPNVSDLVSTLYSSGVSRNNITCFFKMDAQHINGEFARSSDIWKPDLRVSSDDITLPKPTWIREPPMEWADDSTTI